MASRNLTSKALGQIKTLKLTKPDEGIDECSRDGNTEPGDQEPDECGDVLPDDVLDHPALQLGHVDGEEGSDDQDQGVQGEEARLITPDARNHNLRSSLIAENPNDLKQSDELTFRRIFS